ncbi:hypothetical protein ACWFR1_16515 [Streptomyces sp. NPDC055103]
MDRVRRHLGRDVGADAQPARGTDVPTAGRAHPYLVARARRGEHLRGRGDVEQPDLRHYVPGFTPGDFVETIRNSARPE